MDWILYFGCFAAGATMGAAARMYDEFRKNVVLDDDGEEVYSYSEGIAP